MAAGGLDHTQHLLDRADAARRERLLREEARSAEGPGKGWCCGGCGARVTEADQAIEMRGSHTHRRTNPHGLEFLIGCFRRADGCMATGQPTEQWSWFPGYGWQPALCHRCRAQLGWYFSGAGEPFFGLIIDRLARCPDGD